MKNRADLESTLKAELDQWFIRQSKDIYSDFYLYYLPTTAEHDGGILICKERPANLGYCLAMAEKINKSATVNQNFNWIRNEIIGRLPVLSKN